MMTRVSNCASVHKGRVKKQQQQKKNMEKQIEHSGELLAPKGLEEFNS